MPVQCNVIPLDLLLIRNAVIRFTRAFGYHSFIECVVEFVDFVVNLVRVVNFVVCGLRFFWSTLHDSRTQALFLSLLLSSLELSDTKDYEPYIRALLGTASHFCEVVALKSRTANAGYTFPTPAGKEIIKRLSRLGSR